uniref:HTH APSES-type domain-containing protein n=1 Tax=Kwoniella pini CBS 10737 TaxID=1296096 RepID=A0A1B9ICJ5_9TREE|nr:uncharacterized protein I206_00667 [Kwoniella pini CBS 10737]OCF53365.1 hypothetical protein I206_00667 [Kwoniella pini CBS 10737]
MARPIRPAPAPPTGSSSSTTSTPLTSTLRTSSRPHRPSAAALASASTTGITSAPSTPFTPGPATPSDLGSSSKGRPSSIVESKTHGLRSVGGASERTPCPFPTQWGGRDKCGLTEEDEADEVLMGILGSIAYYDNRALSVEEIASTCFQQGWLRPPSAAIEPTTPINNSIRSYIKRCERSRRHCLLSKHQLAGSVVEQVLQPALHPNAFDGAVRPKGTVWFLIGGNGKSKWRNPFDGIEVPKIPPRKPAPKKIQPQKENKVVKVEDKKVSNVQKGKTKIPAPVKIRLVLNGPAMGEEENISEPESSLRSRSVSVDQETNGLGLAQPISLPQMKAGKKPKSRRPRDILDSSSESDTSESEMEFDIPGPSRLIRRTTSLRKVPPPLTLGGSPRVHSSSRLPQHSPFMDIFYPSPIIPTSPFLPHASPFPSHSLDNTTWVARHDQFHSQFETSSSSSDDEMRETTWGMDSEILIKAVDGDDEHIPSWSMDEDETKVKEATDALRVLFPLSSPDEEADLDSKIKLNQLDNRPSLFESPGSTASAAHNQLKEVDAGGISLNAWIANSSPQGSPNLRTYKNLAPPIDVSPTQHLSKLRSSFDPEEMEVDEETPWLDETGELPVKAEDTFSDVDLNSNVGDAPTPEHDRHLHTALWAQEAAAIRIKQEPEDYPSPVATDPDDQSAAGFRGSRASSTPSSGSSELPPFEIETDNGRIGVDEVILGPESITVEELDGWLPAQVKAEKTPHRGRPSKNRNHPLRCSGNWGGIGVCSALANIVKPAARNRSAKSNATARRRRSSPPPQVVDISRLTPDTDMDDEVDDAIGTADLEQARVEADAREEQHRKACKEKAEQQKAMMEAIRQSVESTHQDHHTEQSTTPWSECNTVPWGTASTESFQIVTPSALSPMALFDMSNLSLGSGCMAVDPKALVSPPLQPAFGFPSMPITPQQPPDVGTQMLDSGSSEQAVKPAISAPVSTLTAQANPSPPVTPASTHAPSNTSTPSFKSTAKLQPIAPAPARLPTPTPVPVSAPVAAPVNVPVQPTAITVTSASAPNERSTAIVALPITLPAQMTPAPLGSASAPTPVSLPTLAPPLTTIKSTKSPALPTTTPPNEPATPSTKSTPSPSSATSTTGPVTNSMPPPANGNGNGKSGTKVATITKPLCPGVDACVVDNIPVYAHLFEGKAGQGRQVLLRRLDTDFVNANALLAALGVAESKCSEYFDHPISAVRLAARHVIPPSSPSAEYSPGVSGIWVHLAEARDFARRAKLKEGSLLSSVLREDLFQLFATLAGLKPDHPTSETFGLSFVPRRPAGVATNSGLSSVNSKSTPNLTALSNTSTTTQQPRQALTGTNTPTTACTGKGPLVRSAPPTPPDGCPGPKRRRATISSPLAKKPGVQPLTTTAPSTPTSAASPHKNQPIAPATGSVPAAGTRLSIAAQKRATRASISGAVSKPAVR